MEVGFMKKYGHKKVRYMLNDQDLAQVILDHWSGDNPEHDAARVARFHHDIDNCGLTLSEFLSREWAG